MQGGINLFRGQKSEEELSPQSEGSGPLTLSVFGAQLTGVAASSVGRIEDTPAAVQLINGVT